MASTPFHGGIAPPSFSVIKPWSTDGGMGGVDGVDEDMFMIGLLYGISSGYDLIYFSIKR